jgi:hypothetical protein
MASRSHDDNGELAPISGASQVSISPKNLPGKILPDIKLWIFRQSASGACFYHKSILLAYSPDDRFHLVLDSLRKEKK